MPAHGRINYVGGVDHMKAIAKTRPELGVEIIDAPMPRPGPNQILVRVAACGICGSDLHIYLWELGADRALSRMPAVIGHEPAGEVVELGAGVTAFKVGDHVALDPFGPCGKCSLCQSGRFNFCKNPGRLGGAFAEYCVAPVENAWLVPKSMDLEEAALLEPFATGLHAVEISDLKAGDGCVIERPGRIGLSTALSARDGMHVDRRHRPRAGRGTSRARARYGSQDRMRG